MWFVVVVCSCAIIYKDMLTSHTSGIKAYNRKVFGGKRIGNNDGHAKIACPATSLVVTWSSFSFTSFNYSVDKPFKEYTKETYQSDRYVTSYNNFLPSF